MKIGFIGAGRAGCSLGRYFSMKTLPDLGLSGFYSKKCEDALWAANFTQSNFFTSLEDVVSESDTIIISTPDSVIEQVWKAIPKETLKGKIVCHLSGSLSSDVFSERESYGVFGISIHPLFAFSNKESVYQQLHNVCFTLEGDSYAVQLWQMLFTELGNPALTITKENKAKYHTAASLLSNHVLAVLDCGYQLLNECGFDDLQARQFTEVLVKNNLHHAIAHGTAEALTGPIERGDTATVQKHLTQLTGSAKDIYQACALRLLEIAARKHPGRSYTSMQELFAPYKKNDVARSQTYSGTI